jgi:hypothetical protein
MEGERSGFLPVQRVNGGGYIHENELELKKETFF